ncbi:ABC transporter ATP-binding protein [Candidatus Nitrosacidococcus tergens]|uniref:Putative peptide transport fused subunits of ABC superfamily: ATP-binding components n=1 Tax=Candidatus Nitrosacidococcus tergens TaxID=553981 RepID=A0A7G1QBT8_9GAMM|nr:dipeptide ABC transporter ATP-binding protein [Candidatus Nitrosacidococcus tergens]CAB1277434.1 putative peptide transport fused subunits of ABC superfamily: ATP-binding components [Candidatus Nitrosacidococcus tergens]
MLLQVNNLKTYFYGKSSAIKAVDGVSFALNKGETLCLVGESGSGKSITALSIMQLLPKQISTHPEGSILFNWYQSDNHYRQVDLLSLPESEKQHIRGAQISMIFQEPMTCLNPVFTIGEQIIETLQLHFPNLNKTEAQERAIHVLEQVRIPSPRLRMNEYPHRLSGGQRQRVMIAMAIACEPDLLIADEPTTALDVTVQAEILALMQELQAKKQMGILFITHDFGVVSQMAHKVGVMQQGKIIESGTLKEVLGNPKRPYTHQLLAALPENLRPLPSSHTPQKNITPAVIRPLLEIENLQVYFPIRKGIFRQVVGHIHAVDNISLIIPTGQILGLVGESGCGKTTLGRAILRLIEPTSGKICYNGTDITTLNQRKLQPYRKELQIIFQDPLSSLNPRLSIATTLIEPMAVHNIGISFQERLDRAENLLKQVRLNGDYLWRYPHELSGGQRQRICIARALALSPKFIVCDEITSALDVSVQAEILELLLELQVSKNLTLLFISHNISVVKYISDEFAVMKEGFIIEKGTTEQICSSPEHPYTQNLLKAVPRINGQGRGKTLLH